ncbi:MAG TPA: FimV/HubP family polar landmark protein [Gammaproteobacteria bacterium]|nr:FimV/HubP family polar landmark protein [Gammaproteobacteria bacterium]
MEAEILLTSVRPGETDGMLIRLASEEAFAQAGVERPFYLTKIKFKLAKKTDGTEYILVSTGNPVNEPFLSFLIDIDWPRGHLVREYTVLLDPPVFTGAQLARSQAESLSEPTVTTDAAGVPALISRDEEGELPDIEMVDETGGAAAETGLSEVTEPASTGIPATDIPSMPATELPMGEEALAGALPEDEIPEDMPQQGSPVATDIGAAPEAGDWSARLEQQSLPEIGFTFDESIPYDIDRTEALLSEFGISLASIGTAREKESGQSAQTAEGADTYKVQEGDTLWEIANQHKNPDVTVQQAMLAILRQNPNGFIRNNINDVKKGFVLRMPERAAMLEVSNKEAVAEVRRQYALWREYHGELAGKSSGQQDTRAVDSQQADAGASTDTSSGQLSILAPGRDAASTGRASGAQEGKEKGDATRLDLQLAREQLEGERLQKVELQSRLNDLTDQLEKMQRLLTLKDEQLAKLQERLRQLESAAKNQTAPRQQPQAGAEEPASRTDPAAADKGSTVKALENEKPSIEIPKPDLVAPDLRRAAPQPDTTTTDNKNTSQDTTANQADLDKLNESIKLSEKELPPITTPDPDSKPKKARSKPRTRPVSEVAPKGGKSFLERLNAVVQPIQGFLRDLAAQHLPSAYKKMADDLLASPAGLGILAGALLLILALVITLIRSLGKVKDKARKPKKTKPAKVMVETPPAEQQETTKITAKPAKIKKAGPSLNERLKKVFAPFAALLAKKPKPAKKAVAEEEDVVENEAAAEDLASAVQEAAVEVKSKAKPQKAPQQGETVKVKSAPVKSAAQNAAAPAAAEEEISDDTTAEADVYLAYGLFDQAEELLKHALATNPGATHYRGKLLETYFAAGKKDEFEKLAAELHKSTGGRAGRIWDKAVAMGKEIAPSNPLFSGAADSGLKASDFAPAKPATADLDLGEAGGATTPDIDFGEVGATETALDLDISGAFDKTVIADDKTMIADDSTMIADDRTMIADDSTMIVDETSLNMPKSKDVTDSELNINFDADELGLGTELEDADNASSTPESESEATMAIDIGLDIDNIEGITDVDSSSGSISSKSAGDDLIAELGGGDSELSLEGASDTEFDLPEDDDTLIDAGDDTFSGDSGGASEDEVSTKLDLAKAYMDMGDYDGASSTLEEVLSEGNDKQKREAEELLDQIN